MTQNEIARKWFVKTAISYLGSPYIWGGDDPAGFDCSGFVVECLKSSGILNEKEDYTADGLFRLYQGKIVKSSVEGDLLFYINKNRIATHVTICLDEYFQIGAIGGNEFITDEQTSWTKNAFIKIRPIGLNNPNVRYVKLF